MKEIHEDIQWEIFEFLEGNLTEEQKTSVLQKISKDKNLEKYYLSLQKTYLKPDNSIVFTQTNKLIKKTIGITFFNPIKYAAAASIIGILSYLFINQFSTTTILETNKVVKKDSILTNNISITKSTAANTPTSENPINSNWEKTNSFRLVKNEQPVLNSATAHLQNRKRIHSEEYNFYHNLSENQYLTNAQKKQIMLKWLLIHSADNSHLCSNQECTEIIANNPPSQSVNFIIEKELSNQWIQEVKLMIKHGELPKIKFVASKNEQNWLPNVGIQLNTQSAALVANIIE